MKLWKYLTVNCILKEKKYKIVVKIRYLLKKKHLKLSVFDILILQDYSVESKLNQILRNEALNGLKEK